MRKFILKFKATNRTAMIWALATAFSISTELATDVYDRGLVLRDDGTVGDMIDAVQKGIVTANRALKDAKAMIQPNVPYTMFTNELRLESFETRPATRFEPIELERVHA